MSSFVIAQLDPFFPIASAQERHIPWYSRSSPNPQTPSPWSIAPHREASTPTNCLLNPLRSVASRLRACSPKASRCWAPKIRCTSNLSASSSPPPSPQANPPWTCSLPPNPLCSTSLPVSPPPNTPSNNSPLLPPRTSGGVSFPSP